MFRSAVEGIRRATPTAAEPWRAVGLAANVGRGRWHRHRARSRRPPVWRSCWPLLWRTPPRSDVLCVDGHCRTLSNVRSRLAGRSGGCSSRPRNIGPTANLDGSTIVLRVAEYEGRPRVELWASPHVPPCHDESMRWRPPVCMPRDQGLRLAFHCIPERCPHGSFLAVVNGMAPRQCRCRAASGRLHHAGRILSWANWARAGERTI